MTRGWWFKSISPHSNGSHYTVINEEVQNCWVVYNGQNVCHAQVDKRVQILLQQQLRTGRTGVCPNQKNIVHRIGEYPKVGDSECENFL